MAELIEYNLDDVDAAILAVRVALAKGMNWDDLARMAKEVKKAGNPVASLIERNCMTLLLSTNLEFLMKRHFRWIRFKFLTCFCSYIMWHNTCIKHLVCLFLEES